MHPRLRRMQRMGGRARFSALASRLLHNISFPRFHLPLLPLRRRCSHAASVFQLPFCLPLSALLSFHHSLCPLRRYFITASLPHPLGLLSALSLSLHLYCRTANRSRPPFLCPFSRPFICASPRRPRLRLYPRVLAFLRPGPPTRSTSHRIPLLSPRLRPMPLATASRLLVASRAASRQ